MNGSYRRRAVLRLQIHRLRRRLSCRLLLRGGADVIHPPRGMHRLRGLRPRVPGRGDLSRRQPARRLEGLRRPERRRGAQVPGHHREEGRDGRRVLHAQEVMTIAGGTARFADPFDSPSPRPTPWGFLLSRVAFSSRRRKRKGAALGRPFARLTSDALRDHFCSSLDIDSPPARVISLMRTALPIWFVTGETLPSHRTKFTRLGCLLAQFGRAFGTILLMVWSILVRT